MQGGPDVDDLTGGAGDDNLQGNAGDDHLRGGAGNDELDFPGSASVEQGADTLEGGPGDDRINPGTAAPLEGDTLSGDAGRDKADYSTRTEPLTIDVDGKPDDGESGEHDNVLPGTECVDGGSNDDRLLDRALRTALTAVEEKTPSRAVEETTSSGAEGTIPAATTCLAGPAATRWKGGR